MRHLGILGLMGLAAGSAGAEPISGKDAKALLFAPKGAEVEMLAQDFLSETDVKALAMVGEGQAYYGAIAVSPSEGLMVEATVAAANYHDTPAAEAAALAGCEAKRKGDRPCQVVALIRPKGWESRDLQLSAEATTGFLDGYTAPAAFAVSPSAGVWGLGADATAAVAACTAKGDAGDCAVVIAD